jgi:hypothetical protein
VTVMSTTSKEFSIDELVRLAYRRAALLEVHETLDETRAAAGRELLQLIVHECEAEGLEARCKTTELVVLTANDYTYNLSSATVDVAGDAEYIAASEVDVTKASAETRVQSVSFERWHQISAKSATGRPTHFSALRNGTTVAINLWPIPSEAGRIRFVVWRKLADATDGNATLDLERQWASYVVLRMGRDLALEAGNDEKAALLGGYAKEMLPKMKAFDGHHAPTQVYIEHDTGWSYR